MAPYAIGQQHTIPAVLLVMLIGFLFGFVLERSGFGNSCNLAAQFYLHNMRVLKVMFTAIVTAMLLVFLASAMGLLDFSRVWVPPTYLGSAIVGGLLLGAGFIIGGYCPGTSLVSLATLKLDGVAFVGGVLFGLFAFSETVPACWAFYNYSGSLGRLTLFDLLGVDAGVVVLCVVFMALGAFAFAEWSERRFAREDRPHRKRSSRRVLFRRLGMAAALGVALLTFGMRQRSIEREVLDAQVELTNRIESREAHIDPAELLGLMHNNQVRLVLLDVRSEKDYNSFHLLDAKHITLNHLDRAFLTGLPDNAIVVFMSNDERMAELAWKRLAWHPNVNAYLLAGGVNRWLDLYRQRSSGVPGPQIAPDNAENFRHAFAKAVGSGDPAARPAIDQVPPRSFTAKVKVRGAKRSIGGGCG